MSTSYTCKAYLDTTFGEKNLLQIAQKGKLMGFIYLDQQSYSDYLPHLKHLTPEESVKNIINGKTLRKNDNDFPGCLTILYEKTYFSIDFYEIDQNLVVHLFPLFCEWTKYIDKKEYFDFGRYVKLLIDLCEDFPIVKIETEVD